MAKQVDRSSYLHGEDDPMAQKAHGGDPKYAKLSPKPPAASRASSSTNIRGAVDSTDARDLVQNADPVLQQLAENGFTDRGTTGNPIDDLRRKIDITPYPPAMGMHSPNNPAERAPGADDVGAQGADPVEGN